MDHIVELRNAGFSAQSATIVQDVSIAFEEGRATALIGPSGGGKSTVLKIAAGILVPDRGAVLFRGRDLSAMNRQQNLEFRREAAVVFQDSALWSNQNLSQILELPLSIHFPEMRAAERAERIREVCAQVGYRRTLEIRPALLSMGEQKLIAFARAMLCRPTLYFLDEWTESLDDDAARRLVRLVRQFRGEGKTIVFVSHDRELVGSLADHAVVIAGGKKVMEGPGHEIGSDGYAGFISGAGEL